MASKNQLVKVMKYAVQIDKETTFSSLFDAINETTSICREAVRQRVHLDFLSREYKEKHGDYPRITELSDGHYSSVDGLIYHNVVSKTQVLSSSCVNATIRKALEKYDHTTIPNFKKAQPIVLPNLNILQCNQDNGSTQNHFNMACTVFSNKYKKTNSLSGNVILTLRPKSNSEKVILQRIWDNKYQIGRSELIYERQGRKKGKWILALAYRFEKANKEKLPRKRLGVYMSESVAIYASSPSSIDTFVIDGNDIPAFAQRMEAIQHSKQRQARNCGIGRRGHGRQTRLQPIYSISSKIENFRRTKNDIYSHDIIEYAHSNNITDLFLEDLKGIKSFNGYPKIMQHWTYYDLQDKIRYKAREYNINVHTVKGEFSSKCCKCGYTDEHNRELGVIGRFRCIACGFSSSMNWNASQNIATAEVEKEESEENEDMTT